MMVCVACCLRGSAIMLLLNSRYNWLYSLYFRDNGREKANPQAMRLHNHHLDFRSWIVVYACPLHSSMDGLAATILEAKFRTFDRRLSPDLVRLSSSCRLTRHDAEKHKLDGGKFFEIRSDEAVVLEESRLNQDLKNSFARPCQVACLRRSEI